MAETTPHLAPVVVLLFLAAAFLTSVSILVLLYGAIHCSKLLAAIGASSALMVIGCYGILLLGVSLASSEKVLPMGAWKYFCEVDCHIGYSVSGVQTTATLGPEMQPASAQGEFIIVRMKVWFDEHTISPNRGDGLLTPNPRRLLLVDSSGRTYAESSGREGELARANGGQASLRQPLRPGQSFSKELVFDVPKHAAGLRLLITEDDPRSRLIIGHENSLWHKKIYLGLDPAPNITRVIKPLAPNN
jgi:Domain of unknown function (DUF4352)